MAAYEKAHLALDLATGLLSGTPQFWRIMGLPEIDHPVPIETTRPLRSRAKVSWRADGMRASALVTRRYNHHPYEWCIRIAQPKKEIYPLRLNDPDRTTIGQR